MAQLAQYIDKSVLVAKIEREKAYAQTLYDNAFNSSLRQFCSGMKECCENLLNFLNVLDTLEEKEVDLEKVFNDEYSKFSNNVDAMDYGFPIDLADYKDFAKHFFELGLNYGKRE